MNHSVELATSLYARCSVPGSMSSMRTGEDASVSPAWSSRPPGARRTAARSPSVSAAQTQTWSASPSAATEESPDTRPPPPRFAVSSPSSVRVKDTGPRLEATSTEALPVPSMVTVVSRQGPC